jgi:DNA-binding NarL/FixJ family response regulator
VTVVVSDRRSDGHGMTATPLTVFLVEDHRRVRAAIRQAISADDISVVGEAATAEHALHLAPPLRPDVLLLDIDLPGMSGLQLLDLLVPLLPGTRIVMLTVSSAQADVVEAIAHGAAGYLTKDLDPAALLRAIRGLRSGDLAMPRGLAAGLVRDYARTLRDFISPADRARLAGLSQREHEVLTELVRGLTDRRIAERLFLSPRTVETHVRNILRKLGVRNRAEAAGRYRRLMEPSGRQPAATARFRISTDGGSEPRNAHSNHIAALPRTPAAAARPAASSIADSRSNREDHGDEG